MVQPLDRGIAGNKGRVPVAARRIAAAPGVVSVPRSAGAEVRKKAARVRREWQQLCQWDPALPPDAAPPDPDALVKAIAAALDRPQPLGWGLDPAMGAVAERFAVAVGGIDDALAMLVCLREALSAVVIECLPPEDRHEADRRLQMIIERTMIAAAHSWVALLADAALTDPLTGLWNRRAFERDLERQTAWAMRHNRFFGVAIVDVDGLKAVNDTFGHAAGDETLNRVAAGLRQAIRAEDSAYRLGGDEFGLLLVADHVVDAETLESRLAERGTPPVTIGIASAPPDDPTALVAAADARMYARRATRRTAARPATGRIER